MPTNVSTPIWQCDICRTKFGDNQAIAQRCEAAGHPVTLPAGTPLLQHTQPGYGKGGGFALAKLTGLDDVVTTTAGWNREGEGGTHHRRYRVERADGSTHTDDDRSFSPVLPGFVQTPSGRTVGRHMGDQLRSTLAPWVAKLFGLGAEGSPFADGTEAPEVDWRQSASVAGPITPEVRAVFDALDVQVVTSYYTNYQEECREREHEVYLAGGHLAHARAQLALTSVAARREHLADLTRRWFAGENVNVVNPHLTARSKRTASNLTKDLRALVEQTGVPWEPRTAASDYANTLVRNLLMTTVEGDMNLFAGKTVIAVGGVKGGVGKSTTAAAFAANLAGTGAKVALVDFDLAGPSQHILWNLGPVPVDHTLQRLRATATDVEGLSVFSPGQLGDSLPRRWDDVTTREWVSFVGATLDLDDVDTVVLDLPAGLGAMDAIAAGSGRSVETAAVIHVTTAHPLAISDVARALPREMHADHARIVVENMSRVTGVSTAGDVATVRLHGTGTEVKDLAERYRVTYGGSLPWASEHIDLARSPEMTELVTTVLDRIGKDS